MSTESEYVSESDEKDAEDQLNSMGLQGKLIKRFLKSAKAQGRKGKAFVDTLVIMGEATKLSQMAEKAYWDTKADAPKSRADYARAADLTQRSIRMLDKAMDSFPTTIDTLMPLKKKLMAQELDIKYQSEGKVKTNKELMVEVEESLKPVPKEDKK